MSYNFITDSSDDSSEDLVFVGSQGLTREKKEKPKTVQINRHLPSQACHSEKVRAREDASLSRDTCSVLERIEELNSSCHISASEDEFEISDKHLLEPSVSSQKCSPRGKKHCGAHQRKRAGIQNQMIISSSLSDSGRSPFQISKRSQKLSDSLQHKKDFKTSLDIGVTKTGRGKLFEKAGHIIKSVKLAKAKTYRLPSLTLKDKMSDSDSSDLEDTPYVKFDKNATYTSTPSSSSKSPVVSVADKSKASCRNEKKTVKHKKRKDSSAERNVSATSSINKEESSEKGKNFLSLRHPQKGSNGKGNDSKYNFPGKSDDGKCESLLDPILKLQTVKEYNSQEQSHTTMQTLKGEDVVSDADLYSDSESLLNSQPTKFIRWDNEYGNTIKKIFQTERRPESPSWVKSNSKRVKDDLGSHVTDSSELKHRSYLKQQCGVSSTGNISSTKPIYDNRFPDLEESETMKGGGKSKIHQKTSAKDKLVKDRGKTEPYRKTYDINQHRDSQRMLTSKQSQKCGKRIISEPESIGQNNDLELEDDDIFSPWMSTQTEKKLDTPNVRMVTTPKIDDHISEPDDGNKKLDTPNVRITPEPKIDDVISETDDDDDDGIESGSLNFLALQSQSQIGEEIEGNHSKHEKVTGNLFSNIQPIQNTSHLSSGLSEVKKSSNSYSQGNMSQNTSFRGDSIEHLSLLKHKIREKTKLSLFSAGASRQSKNTKITGNSNEVYQRQSLDSMASTSSNSSQDKVLKLKDFPNDIQSFEILSRLKEKKGLIQSLLKTALKRNLSSMQHQQEKNSDHKKLSLHGGNELLDEETQPYIPSQSNQQSPKSDVILVLDEEENQSQAMKSEAEKSYCTDATILLSDNDEKSPFSDGTDLLSDSDTNHQRRNKSESKKSDCYDTTVLLFGENGSQERPNKSKEEKPDSDSSDVTILLSDNGSSQKRSIENEKEISDCSYSQVTALPSDNDSNPKRMLKDKKEKSDSSISDVTIMLSDNDSSPKRLLKNKKEKSDSSSSDVTVLLSNKESSQKRSLTNKKEKSESSADSSPQRSSSKLWRLESESTMEYSFSGSFGGEGNEVMPSSMSPIDGSTSSVPEKLLQGLPGLERNPSSSALSEIVSFQDKNDASENKPSTPKDSSQSQKELFQRTSSMPSLSLCPSSLSQTWSVEGEDCSQLMPELMCEMSVDAPQLTCEQLTLPKESSESRSAFEKLPSERYSSVPKLISEHQTQETHPKFSLPESEKLMLEEGEKPLPSSSRGERPSLEENDKVSDLSSSKGDAISNVNSIKEKMRQHKKVGTTSLSHSSKNASENKTLYLKGSADIATSCQEIVKKTNEESHASQQSEETAMFSQNSSSTSDALKDDIHVLENLEVTQSLHQDNSDEESTLVTETENDKTKSDMRDNESDGTECPSTLESMKKANKLNEVNTSFYEAEDDHVHVYDSDDEELFNTQSMFSNDLTTIESSPLEETSEDDYRTTQDNSLWWDDEGDDASDNESLLAKAEASDAKRSVPSETPLSNDGVEHDFKGESSDSGGNNNNQLSSKADEEVPDKKDSMSRGYTLQTRYFDEKFIKAMEARTGKSYPRSGQQSSDDGNSEKNKPNKVSVRKEESIPDNSMQNSIQDNVSDTAMDTSELYDQDTQVDPNSDDSDNEDSYPYLQATQAVGATEDSADNDNGSDFDEEDYFAHTQIDYLIISSDEDEGNEEQASDEELFDMISHLDRENVPKMVRKEDQLESPGGDVSQNEFNLYQTETLEEDADTSCGHQDTEEDPYAVSTQVDEIPDDHHINASGLNHGIDKSASNSPVDMSVYEAETLVDVDQSISDDLDNNVDPYEMDTQVDVLKELEDLIDTIESEDSEKTEEDGKSTQLKQQDSFIMPTQGTLVKSSHISADEGVSENNIVEYISSTQVDGQRENQRPTRTPSVTKQISRRKPGPVTEGLFDRIMKEHGKPLPSYEADSDGVKTSSKNSSDLNKATIHPMFVEDKSLKQMDESNLESENEKCLENRDDDGELDDIFNMNTQVDMALDEEQKSSDNDLPDDLFTMQTLVEDNYDDDIPSESKENEGANAENEDVTSAQPESTSEIQSESNKELPVQPRADDEATDSLKSEIENETSASPLSMRNKEKGEREKDKAGSSNSFEDLESTLEYGIEQYCDDDGKLMIDQGHNKVNIKSPTTAEFNIPSAKAKSEGLDKTKSKFQADHVSKTLSGKGREIPALRQEPAASKVKSHPISSETSSEKVKIGAKRKQDVITSPKKILKKAKMVVVRSFSKVSEYDKLQNDDSNKKAQERSDMAKSSGSGIRNKIAERWLSASCTKITPKPKAQAKSQFKPPYKSPVKRSPLPMKRRPDSASLTSQNDQIKRAKILMQKRIQDGAVSGASGVSHWRSSHGPSAQEMKELDNVEMPSTQEMIDFGLPILNAQLPIDKKKLAKGIPNLGHLRPSASPGPYGSGKMPSPKISHLTPGDNKPENDKTSPIRVENSKEASSSCDKNLMSVQFREICEKVKNAGTIKKPEVKNVAFGGKKALTLDLPEEKIVKENDNENVSTAQSSASPQTKVTVDIPGKGMPKERETENIAVTKGSASPLIPHHTDAMKSSSTSPLPSAMKTPASMFRKPGGILKDRNCSSTNQAKLGARVKFDASRNKVTYVEPRPTSAPSASSFSIQPGLSVGGERSPAKTFTPFLSETDFIFKLVSWNPGWLPEQNKQGKPPPILGEQGTFSLLRTSYDDIESYQKTSFELLLLEIWAMIHTDWKKICHEEHLPALICSKPQHSNEVEQRLGILSFELKVIVRQAMKHSAPMSGDLIILSMRGRFIKNPQKLRPNMQFGFVKDVVEDFNREQHRNLFIKMKENLQLQAPIESRARVFNVKICMKYKTFVPLEFLKVQRVSPLTTSRRQFQALVNLPKNPVSKALINPQGKDPVFFIEESLADSGLKALNEEQAVAVTTISETILDNPHQPKVCLLQGPPGTGKSHTILALIHQILIKSRFKARICLAAPSNAAVDEIARRIITFSKKKCSAQNLREITVLRVGILDRVMEVVKPCHLENKVKEKSTQFLLDKSPSLRDELKMVKSKIDSLKALLRSARVPNAQRFGPPDLAAVSQMKSKKVSSIGELKRLEQDLRNLEAEARKATISNQDRRRLEDGIVEESHVICSTLSSFGSGFIQPLLRYRFGSNTKRQPFNCLIIDEATQAIEMEALIPLQYMMSKVVLVGDQKQLPPTVNSKDARDNRFDRSLFERLHSKFSHSGTENPIMTLKKQYRMHPEILVLPNSYFYHDELYTAESILNSRQSALSPYLVFDMQDGQETQDKLGSFSNKVEATFVAKLCHQVMRKLNVKHNFKNSVMSRIGIICPYADQKHKIQDCLKSIGLGGIEVNTVDSFQGQERDVIILSCVRAQTNPQTIGFTGDSKRMNVALTRAKLALYIVGHFKTLSISDLWRLLYENAKERQLLVPVSRWNGTSQEPFQAIDLKWVAENRKR